MFLSVWGYKVLCLFSTNMSLILDSYCPQHSNRLPFWEWTTANSAPQLPGVPPFPSTITWSTPLCTCPSCSLPHSIHTNLFSFSLCGIMYWVHVATASQHSCGFLQAVTFDLRLIFRNLPLPASSCIRFGCLWGPLFVWLQVTVKMNCLDSTCLFAQSCTWLPKFKW